MPFTESLKKIQNYAADFENTAHLVNESSHHRKKYTDDAISLLDSVIATANALLKEMKQISGEAVILRNRHTEALNTIKILSNNIKKQDHILQTLPAEALPESTAATDLAVFNSKLLLSLEKGIMLLEKIIDRANEIILLDNQLLNLKKFQNKKNLHLKRLSHIALKDAEKSIHNSAANHHRGTEFVESLRNIPELARTGDLAKIENLIEKAAAGRKSASMVNISSKAQFVFTDRVNLATKQLHTGSLRVRDMIQEKYRLFNENLETATEAAVLMSLEFLDYLPARGLLKQFRSEDISFKKEGSLETDDIAALVFAASDEIESLSGLNFDVTESTALNSRLERSAIELTAQEIDLYNTLKSAVELMTESARYPVEGSARNMDNARELEKRLKNLLSEIG